MTYKLSPSDLTFLYQCKHCFVLKIKHGIPQPSIPLPAIFSKIAALQKEAYSGRRMEEIGLGLPNGVIKYGERWVRSRVLEIPGSASACYLAGRFDIVAELDDRTYAVLDFKTGSPGEEKSEMYARQLQAYAIALENPGERALALTPVSKLGLLYFSPDKCQPTDASRQSLDGALQWVEIQRNDSSFFAFLKEVLNLLAGPLPPPEPETCNWCSYRRQTSEFAGSRGVAGASTTESSTPTCPTCGAEMRKRTGKFGEFWSCVRYPDCKGTRNVGG